MCRLGLALGKTIQELEQLPVSELRTWNRFLASYPLPMERVERQIAALTAKLHNVNLGKGKAPLQAEDFVLYKFPRSKEDQAREASSRYTPLDRAIMAALRGGGR